MPHVFGRVELYEAPSGQPGALLTERDALQANIDVRHSELCGQDIDPVAYRAFLEQIGYIVPEGADFAIDTSNVDAEITTIAGPQPDEPHHQGRHR